MDPDVLVEDRIVDGRRLLEQLTRDGVPVCVAFWLLPSEDAAWRLVVATPLVEEIGLNAAIGRVFDSQQKVVGSSLDLSDLSVSAASDPAAVAAAEERDRYPSTSFRTVRGKKLGRYTIYEARIYPPLRFVRQAFRVEYSRQGDSNLWRAEVVASDVLEGLTLEGPIGYSGGPGLGDRPEIETFASVSVLVKVDPSVDQETLAAHPALRRLLESQARATADEVFRRYHPEARVEHDSAHLVAP